MCGTLIACFAATGAPGAAEVRQSDDVQLIKQLSAVWWQWALSIPAASNPLTFDDPEGAAAHCGVGQHGDVWFLGGSLTGGPADRRCTLPAGKRIFFPVVNVECSMIQGDGTSQAELRSCAGSMMDRVTSAEVWVDDIPLDPIRVASDMFTFTTPPGDINDAFGGAPNPSPAVSDGFWVLLEPLSEGPHTITFGGEVPLPSFTFRVEVNYAVEVVAAGVE